MTPSPKGANEPAGDGADEAAGAETPPVDLDLAELYRQQQPFLRRRLAGFGRRTDAEDLAQEAFLKTWANRQRLDGSEDGGRAYLHTAAGNLLRDRWRRERRAARGDVLLTAVSDVPQPAADTVAVANFEATLVRTALSRLDDDKRQVLRLRVLEGRSSEETARLTRKTAAAVRQTQHRALLALRAELAALGYAPSSSAGRGEES